MGYRDKEWKTEGRSSQSGPQVPLQKKRETVLWAGLGLGRLTWDGGSDSGTGDLGSCHPSHFVGVWEERRGQEKQSPCRRHPSTPRSDWGEGRASLEGRNGGGAAHGAVKQGAWAGGRLWRLLGHSHSLSDVDPGAHDVVRRHGLKGEKSLLAWVLCLVAGGLGGGTLLDLQVQTYFLAQD